MNKYKVGLYPRALRDLEEIYGYIAFEKYAPDSARAQVDRIKEAILSLDTFPERHQDRVVGRYQGKGYKQLLIDNHIVIYKMENKDVCVVTVQYKGRNI